MQMVIGRFFAAVALPASILCDLLSLAATLRAFRLVERKTSQTLTSPVTRQARREASTPRSDANSLFRRTASCDLPCQSRSPLEPVRARAAFDSERL